MNYLSVKRKAFEHTERMVRRTDEAAQYFDGSEWVGGDSPIAVTVAATSLWLRLIRETKTGITAVVRRENPDSCQVGPWPDSFQVEGGTYSFEPLSMLEEQ